MFDREYERLIVTGSASETTLENTWQNLYQEYCGLTNQGNLSDHMRLLQDCNVAISYMQMVESIAKCLAVFYDPELIGILEELGLKPGINPNDEFDVIRLKLEKVLIRAKKFVVQYKKSKQQLDRIEAENKDKFGTRSQYEDALTTLSRHYGYPVKANDVSVGRFVRETEKLNLEMQRRLAKQKH